LGIYRNDLSKIILNVGAGNNDFGFEKPTVINLDICESRVKCMRNPVVGNAQMLPIGDESVDAVVCVGSVINYCDAAMVIAEFERVIRPGGLLVLEFESSSSAEYFKQSVFGQSAGVAETFYGGQTEAIWVYSPSYMNALLTAAGLSLVKRLPIHILSPWALLALGNSNRAATIARLDSFAKWFPFLSHWASNYLFFCAKQT
jgi:SAM-dependent methyltransferase